MPKTNKSFAQMTIDSLKPLTIQCVKAERWADAVKYIEEISAAIAEDKAAKAAQPN